MKKALIWVASFAVALLVYFNAYAQTTIPSGPCMQDRAGFSLNCSANDIQIASVTNLVILDDGCQFPGDEVSFQATFEVKTTATKRYDIGLYFAADGDPNGDGALSGLCSTSTMPAAPNPPWLDLDGDACGDINKPQHNPLYPTITLTNVVCQDSDGDGFLNLPNCTSWRQTDSLCTGPADAFPGAPSKCNCDNGFNVPIPVPAATLSVLKGASPLSVPEPGGLVTFYVVVSNTGIDPLNAVTLDSLTDDMYGDITSSGHDGIVSTTCALPPPVFPGSDYSCSFVAMVSGDAGQDMVDIVIAAGVDAYSNQVSAQDDATVSITNVLPSASLTKTAVSAVVTYQVDVFNTSAVEPLVLSVLNDDQFGDVSSLSALVSQTTCSVPQVLPVGGSYSCQFDGLVTSSPHTNTVSGTIGDNDGSSLTVNGSATVTLH
jgi:hypothetical protein